MTEFEWPAPPVFSPAEIERCKEQADYHPLLFEWYKYVGILAAYHGMIDAASPALVSLPTVHYAVLTGSLNRCSRLMLANLRLSNDGKHGEAARIIDRCIFETCVKVMWLCTAPDADRFDRFLADGLKGDLELKQHIQREIRARNGPALVIEERMQQSIGRCISLAGMDDATVDSTKKLPNMAALLEAIGYCRLSYVATERMGSHAVHGSWTELVTNYLEYDGALFHPSDNTVAMHENQYVGIMLFVLRALEAFDRYAFAEEATWKFLCDQIASAIRAVHDLFDVVSDGDFVAAP